MLGISLHGLYKDNDGQQNADRTSQVHSAPNFQSTTLFLVFSIGMIGGFVGLQRQLTVFDENELHLLAESWLQIALGPLVGGVLAMLLYILFIAGLVEGTLFPHFVADGAGKDASDFTSLFAVHGEKPAEYAKLIFWSFVAGYSEKFVTNIVSRFDTDKPQKIPSTPSPQQPPTPLPPKP